MDLSLQTMIMVSLFTSCLCIVTQEVKQIKKSFVY
jgi:hypothetical protein